MAEFKREQTLERTHAGLSAAKALGRGGRKPALGPAEVKRARTMLVDSFITVSQVSHQLEVRPATLYWCIPGGRSAVGYAPA